MQQLPQRRPERHTVLVREGMASRPGQAHVQRAGTAGKTRRMQHGAGGSLTRRRTGRTHESGTRTASSTKGHGHRPPHRMSAHNLFPLSGWGGKRMELAAAQGSRCRSDSLLAPLLPARAPPLGRLRRHKVSEEQERERGRAAYLQIIARANIEGGQGVAQPLAMPVAIHHLHLLFGRNRELPANALDAHGVRCGCNSLSMEENARLQITCCTAQAGAARQGGPPGPSELHLGTNSRRGSSR